jgi:acetyl-CoA carboxylase carboxyl transferase subunit alpha
VAIATANRILMLEHAIYTVASPEAAASILWKDAARNVEAATNMRITAQDLLNLKVIDAIVPEPLGGAHRDPAKAADNIADAIDKALSDLEALTPDEIRRHRSDRFLEIGRSL